MQERDGQVARALEQSDLESANISDAERRLLEYTRLITEQAYKATEDDVETLRQAGWSDDQIAEAVYIIAMFAFFNRVADAFGLEAPNFSDMQAKKSDNDA